MLNLTSFMIESLMELTMISQEELTMCTTREPEREFKDHMHHAQKWMWLGSLLHF